MEELLNQKNSKNEALNSFDDFIEKANSTDIEVISSLNSTNPNARDEFLADPTLTKPNNSYDNLDIEKVEHNLNEISDTLNALDWDFQLSDKQKTLVKIVLEDNQKKNNFLQANYHYNHAQNEHEKAQATSEHHHANEILYGKPDEDIFYSILQGKLNAIDVDNLSEQNQQLYQDLIAKIGPMPDNCIERFHPKPETVKRFSEQINVFFANFLKHIPEDQDTFTVQEVCDMTNEILHDELGGSKFTDYHAEVIPNAANASVEHDQRIIKFPGNRAKGDYTAAECKTIIVHELGTHVLRAIPYEKQGIEAFSKGLPGNEVFDEGVAKCVEQAIKGKYIEAGIDHYLNIGLANFKNKNFREVFEIGTTLKFLANPNADKATIEKNYFNPVQRCFRGTGELPNNKDLVYYNGASQVWQYIEQNIDDPNLFDNLFLSGKADILDINQSRLIYEMKTGGLSSNS